MIEFFDAQPGMTRIAPAGNFAFWLLAAMAAFCVGLSKSGLGGFGMLTVLLMAMILPARESTGVVLPMLLFADLFAVRVFHHHARWPLLRTLLPPAIAGILCGALLMPVIPPGEFAPVIGWIVLAMCGVQLVRRIGGAKWEGRAGGVSRHAAFGLGMGWFSGVTTMLANAAGPITSLYLLARGVPKMEFVGTAAVFFLVVNATKIPFSLGLGLITGRTLWFNLLLAPAVLAGFWIGTKILKRLPQRLFEDFLLGFVALASLAMIF